MLGYTDIARKAAGGNVEMGVQVAFLAAGQISPKLSRMRGLRGGGQRLCKRKLGRWGCLFRRSQVNSVCWQSSIDAKVASLLQAASLLVCAWRSHGSFRASENSSCVAAARSTPISTCRPQTR